MVLKIEVANDGETGLKKALENDYDLFNFGFDASGSRWIEICRQVRDEKNTPIIMVSAKKDDMTKSEDLVLEQTIISQSRLALVS